MAKTSLVLTILGQDRPGLVDVIARIVAENGGNWIDSRMAHLGGQFAGILRVEVAPEQTPALTKALDTLSDVGLKTTVHTEPVEEKLSQMPRVRLTLLGQDQPGIVRQVSHVLAGHGVNVENLNTECRRAPNSGQALFHATAEVCLPAGISINTLQTALESVAADMMVDLSIE